MKHAISYTLLALTFVIIGIGTQECFWFVGAMLIGICAFYWIWKEWKRASYSS